MRCRVAAVQITPALLVEVSCLFCVKGNTCIAKDISLSPLAIVVKDEHENRKFHVTCGR